MDMELEKHQSYGFNCGNSYADAEGLLDRLLSHKVMFVIIIDRVAINYDCLKLCN